MKPFPFFLLFSAISSSLAFQQPLSRLWNLFRPVRIPKFILDLDHEYVKTNYYAIKSLDDPAEALCNATSIQRDIIPTVPADLFRRLVIDQDLLYEEDLVYVEARLAEIQACPAAIETCQEFRLALDGEDELLQSSSVTRLVADIWSRMPNLTSLEWEGCREASASLFREEFLRVDLSLPSLLHLGLQEHTAFLLEFAQNIQSVGFDQRLNWFNPWQGLEPRNSPKWKVVDALRDSEHLTQVRIKALWTPPFVESLHQSAPGLENLTIRGSLEGYIHTGDTEPDLARIKAILPALLLFENLTSLDLPGPYGLGMSNIESVGCANAYFGPGGTKYGRTEEIRDMSASERAGRLILKAVPHLQTLCVGGSCVKNDGTRPLLWPWTNRVREYLLDSWPRWADANEGGLEDTNGPVFGSWEEDEKWLVNGELPYIPTVDLDIVDEEEWTYPTVETVANLTEPL
ncbi:hypothetical protein B0I35DRAFT_446990 [Stachybotrys elegans]|uniref:Uncharacterized protein n=1 Tax=Stachybotrys elegans TaxID=80388 RepID=A0A8K0SCV9_9HYPO|nr:hypothetical protein B0I35DRAFT_446990 [Stachybotrys elegans]